LGACHTKKKEKRYSETKTSTRRKKIKMVSEAYFYLFLPTNVRIKDQKERWKNIQIKFPLSFVNIYLFWPFSFYSLFQVEGAHDSAQCTHNEQNQI
jgi:curved DNA-binding protein CbpA